MWTLPFKTLQALQMQRSKDLSVEECGFLGLVERHSLITEGQEAGDLLWCSKGRANVVKEKEIRNGDQVSKHPVIC